MTSGSVPDEEIVAFVDGRLDPARAAQIDSLLNEQPELARRVEVWRRQTQMLRSVLDPIAAQPVPVTLASSLLRPRQRWRGTLVAAGAAAALFFPAGLWLGWYLGAGSSPSPTPEQADIARVAQSGMAIHRIYVVEVRRPVEVSADDQTTLLAWLTKRVDAPVRAPNLSTDGLKLLGGRLVPSSSGKPAALLMYEGDNGDRFTLFMEPTTASRMASLRYEVEGAVAAYAWVDGGIAYSLNGPAEKKRLWSIARAAYDQLD
ncbi:MAG: anti-sigma factor [Bauldia sp.]